MKRIVNSSLTVIILMIMVVSNSFGQASCSETKDLPLLPCNDNSPADFDTVKSIEIQNMVIVGTRYYTTTAPNGDIIAGQGVVTECTADSGPVIISGSNDT